mgnify:CR=1 FL=1
MRVGFLTLGCKVNSYETEKMKIKFEEQGHTVVAFEEKADVYIVNTCTVTNIADRKSRKMLHRAKRRNPNSLVVAAGCYVDSSDKKGEKDSSVDLFVTNAMKEDLVAFVVEAMKERNIVPMQVTEEEFEKEHHMTKEAMAQKHTRAYLKVQNGCNQYCTYCIIPYVRGPLNSKPVEDVVYEVEQLAKDGIQEVVLTGIHLSSYGVDLTECKNFLELEGRMLLKLIRNVAKVDGIERIRLGSLEPRIITKNFLEELSQIPEVCPHFHLSLQSGCDQTLRRMNRHYSADEYEAGVKMIRAYFKHPAITTDIIVGFPQETEEEFEETRKFLEEIDLYEMHVFKYSIRKGTKAADMKPQINDQIKAKRSNVLLEMSKQHQKEFETKQLGMVKEVLIEEKMHGKDHYYTGHTKEYMKVALYSEEPLENKIVKVKLRQILDDGYVLAEC